MTHIEIKEDGQIYVIEGMPESSDFVDQADDRESYDAKGYEAALSSAPRILCADQEQAALIIRRHYGLSCHRGLNETKPGIYSIPDVEWEKGTKPVQVAFERWDYEQVAILKESLKTNTDMKNQGLIKKYNIQKANGEPVDPRSEFFVLRLDPFGEMNHVKACRKAVNVYANAIEHFIPELAKDLRERYPFEESPKEESQEGLTVADIKAFIDRELDGYKVVHIGHGHKVIDRQFIYESDVTSLALELLQNFIITRKP